MLILFGVDFGYYDTLPESNITQQKIDAYKDIEGVEFVKKLNEGDIVEFWLIFHNHNFELDNKIVNMLNQ